VKDLACHPARFFHTIRACFPFSDIALLLLLWGMEGIERIRLPYTQKPRRVNNLRAGRR
jgi:hypothetical protein